MGQICASNQRSEDRGKGFVRMALVCLEVLGCYRVIPRLELYENAFFALLSEGVVDDRSRMATDLGRIWPTWRKCLAAYFGAIAGVRPV